MRLFIAIALEESLRKSLADLQSELKRTGADVRYVAPENIHLTMRFLGEVDEQYLPSLETLLKSVAGEHVAFKSELRELGAFPRLASPRVIWVGCQEINAPGKLLQIYQGLERGLLNLGFPPDDHGFSPHITIGRTKSSGGRAALVRFLQEETGYVGGVQTVREVTLFQSQLHPTGPIYSVVVAAPLKN